MNTGNALEQTQNWVREIVVGLGLCPFAAQPLLQKKVGFFLFAGNDPGDLMRCLLELAADMLERPASELETALLVHPECLTDFEEYLDFVYEAEAVFPTIVLKGPLPGIRLILPTARPFRCCICCGKPVWKLH